MKERKRIPGKFLLFIGMTLFLKSAIYAQQDQVIKEPVQENVQSEQNVNLQIENPQNVQGDLINANPDNGKEIIQPVIDKEKTPDPVKVKQVKSSRPDLTKANGARPPTIVRPSGSGIPKGVGKPGGAVGPGRR
jgi:hypothetical protein